MCKYCNGVEDTVEHTLLQCDRWADQRSQVEQLIRKKLIVNMVSEIVNGPEKSQLLEDTSSKNRILALAKRHLREFYAMVENIMTTKETDERERQTVGDRYPYAPEHSDSNWSQSHHWGGGGNKYTKYFG